MSDARPPKPGFAACNLAVLVVLGLSGCWWVLYFTDWFPVVLGLLGLGGFFAWIAFVINLLTDDRKKQFQHHFDACVLQTGWLPWVGLIFLVVGWFGVAPRWGTLVVDSLESNVGHLVEVSKLDKGEPAGEPMHRAVLTPGGTTKILLFTRWFSTTEYYVKVSRLPAQRITLNGLSRETLLVPDMLLDRLVILARPAANLAGPLAEGFSFQALLDGELIGQIKDYRGQPVWVAADEETALPEHLLQRWQQEFVRAELDLSWVELWRRPSAVAATRVLPPRSTVTVRLVLRSTLSRETPEVRYEEHVTVSESAKSTRFPEELVFRKAP